MTRRALPLQKKNDSERCSNSFGTLPENKKKKEEKRRRKKKKKNLKANLAVPGCHVLGMAAVIQFSDLYVIQPTGVQLKPCPFQDK